MTSQSDKQSNNNDNLTQGYEKLLKRVEKTLSSVTEHTEDTLSQALGKAKERAIELEELTQEEADKVHEFVTRDLYSAGLHLVEEERDVADWLRLNLLLIEKKLLHRFTALSQAAKLELNHLNKAKQRFDEWHTGEVTTIGTLSCKSCGEQIQFKHTGRIPPCPKCHATLFERVKN